MEMVMLFWLALLLPGFVIVRRFAPEELEAGMPGGVAVSFVATLAMLTPVCVVGYLLGAPLAVLSAAVVLAVLASIVIIVRAGWWRELGTLLLTGLCLEMAIVILDLVLGGRVGSILGADAIVHIGRVRFLMDHGLSNADHFVAGDWFYPIYHTNILHALLGVCGQVTRTDHVTVWFASLPMAKLLVMSGGAYAAWAIFRGQWAAWVVALLLLGHRGPVTFMLYPNQLSPWFLIPMLIAVVVRVFDGDCRLRGAVAIALVAMLLGQVHSMYAAFAMLAVGPVLGILALNRLFRRRPDGLAAVACAAALLFALPFPAVSHVGMRGKGSDRPALIESVTATADETTGERTLSRWFKRFDNGWVMHRFGRGFTGGRGYRVPWLVIGCVVAMVGVNRRRAGVLLGVFATVALLLYVPPLCTRLLSVLGSEWVLQRFATLQDVCFAILVPGVIASVAERAIRRESITHRAERLTMPVARVTLAIIAVYAGASLAAQRRPYNWKTYLDRSAAPKGIRLGGTLRPMLRLKEDLDEHVESGAIVLADESMSMLAVALSDCRIIYPVRSGVGIQDLYHRRRDLRLMLRGRTPEHERASLLEQYDVTHLLVTRPAPRWAMPLVRDYRVVEGNRCLIQFRRPDDPDDLAITGDYGIALLDAGRIEEAIPYLDDLLATGKFRRRFRIANALYDAGLFERAIEAYAAASESRPQDPRLTIMIGNAQSALGRYEEALGSFRRTAELAEKARNTDAIASAWFNIGNTHYRQACWQEAVDAYAMTLDCQPEHAGALDWIDRARQQLHGTDGGGVPSGDGPLEP